MDTRLTEARDKTTREVSRATQAIVGAAIELMMGDSAALGRVADSLADAGAGLLTAGRDLKVALAAPRSFDVC